MRPKKNHERTNDDINRYTLIGIQERKAIKVDISRNWL